MSGTWLNCVIFWLRVSFTRYSQQDVLLTHPNKFPFLQAKGVICTARVGWFSRALTCFARSNIHIKNYSAIARRKNIPFYPARTGMNFSYFQLARRSFRFPSQLISQCFFFQLAQILPEEQVFCRAAPLGTPDFSLRLWVVWTTTNYFYSQLAAKLLDGSFELAPLITLNDPGRSMFQVNAS